MDVLLEKLISEFLSANTIEYEPKYLLDKHTTFRIGGKASFFVRLKKIEEILSLYSFIQNYNIPYFLLGGGSNILIADSIFNGIMICISFPEEIQIIHQNKDYIQVAIPSNTRAPWFAKQISSLGYQGLEFLTTIPGQVGGAIIQNAGCYGYEICDVLESVTILQDNKIIILNNSECDFKYRYSRFKKDKNTWIISATFKLPKGDLETITTKIETYKQKRIATQPKNRRSAGSVFKNPEPSITDLKAWQLIKEAGLVGTTIGDAQISPEHANFIINKGNAMANDVYQLIQLVEDKVYQQCKIKLEKEIILVGDF